MSEPKSRLESVNQPDRVMEAIDRRSAWASFLPLKMRLSIGVALALVTGFLFEDRILHGGRLGWSPIVYAAIAAAILALGGAMTLIDHLAARRRRANRKPPVDFG